MSRICLFLDKVDVFYKNCLKKYNISKQNLKENQEKHEAIKKEITPDLIGMIKEWLNKTAVLE